MKAITFKVTKPKPLNEQAMHSALISQANKLGILIAKDYSDITKNWGGGGVKFKHKVKEKKNSIEISVNAVEPRGKGARIWGYLDKGTKAHVIHPRKRKGILSFPSMYRPGSRPNSLFVGKTVSGGPLLHARQVKVSGIQPRNWGKLMQTKWKRQMEKEASFISTTLAKASGHSIK